MRGDQALGTGRPTGGRRVRIPLFRLPAALVVLPLPAPVAPHLAASLALSHPRSRTLRGSLLPVTDIQVPPQHGLVSSDTQPSSGYPRPFPTSAPLLRLVPWPPGHQLPLRDLPRDPFLPEAAFPSPHQALCAEPAVPLWGEVSMSLPGSSAGPGAWPWLACVEEWMNEWMNE